MTGETKRIGARVNVSLLEELQQVGYNSPTEAIIKGLELLIKEAKAGEKDSKCETFNSNSETIDSNCETPDHRLELEVLCAENRQLNAHIETLKRELEQATHDKENSSSMNSELVNSLKTHIISAESQIKAKDEQINQLNEITQKQAVHIQSLIQENSKLNTKLLPENTEKKKWWKLW